MQKSALISLNSATEQLETAAPRAGRTRGRAAALGPPAPSQSPHAGTPEPLGAPQRGRHVASPYHLHTASQRGHQGSASRSTDILEKGDTSVHFRWALLPPDLTSCCCFQEGGNTATL